MKDRMVKLLYGTHRRYGARLHAYVVMSNHLHIISRMPETMDSSAFLQRLKTKSSTDLLPLLTDDERRLISMQVGLDGRQFWKRSFDSLVLANRRTFAQKVRYIHENPIRASLVESAEHYLWSSYASHLAGLWNPEDGLPLDAW